MIINGNILTAEDGMKLTNGEIYSGKVYLGIHDSPENWHEIPEAEVPQETEPEELKDDTEELIEAARILLGVSK